MRWSCDEARHVGIESIGSRSGYACFAWVCLSCTWCCCALFPGVFWSAPRSPSLRPAHRENVEEAAVVADEVLQVLLRGAVVNLDEVDDGDDNDQQRDLQAEHNSKARRCSVPLAVRHGCERRRQANRQTGRALKAHAVNGSTGSSAACSRLTLLRGRRPRHLDAAPPHQSTMVYALPIHPNSMRWSVAALREEAELLVGQEPH